MERLTYDFCIGTRHCWQIKGADNMIPGKDIGKTTFVTREEAEAALKKREADT